MKRSPIKRIGKQGIRNLEANKKLKDIYKQREITECEVKLPNCLFDNQLSWHHRYKRSSGYYKKHPELLSYFNETILCCSSCHGKLEIDRALTEAKFKELRKENE